MIEPLMQDWSKWQPTDDDLLYILKDLVEEIDFCMEECGGSGAEDPFKQFLELSEAYPNVTCEIRTDIQHRYAFIKECTPEDVLDKDYLAFMNKVLGITS